MSDTRPRDEVVVVQEQLLVDPGARAQCDADFTAWVGEHQRHLLSFAVLVVGDRATAQDGRVTRLSAGDVTAIGDPRRLDARWQQVLRGDPRSDRVVVADGDGCQAVLDGATAEPVYRSCDVQLTAFSADGALGAGRNLTTGLLAVVDLASGRLLLALDPEGNPVAPRMVFDDAGVLNLRVGDATVTFAFLVCDLSGDCWRTSPPYAEPIDFVLPNRP